MSDQIEVMINTCFGGFGFSPQAIAEYRRANPEQDTNQIERHDPVMVKIVKDMGGLANGFCAKIGLEKIPSQYVNHYSISEYDGSESVEIHYNKYKVDSAKSILRDGSLTKSEKLASIAAVLNLATD